MIRLTWNPPPVPSIQWHDVSVGQAYRNESSPQVVVVAVAPEKGSEIHACPLTHKTGMTMGVGHCWRPVASSKWIPLNLDIKAEICSV